MLYHSLNGKSKSVSFKEATLNSIAPDNGLYFPEEIPLLQKQFFENIENTSNEAIAFEVMRPYIGNDIPDKELEIILAETFDFPFPLKRVQDSIYSLELFHGPTLAFKDVGARFMSRCMGYFLKNNTKPVTVLVATSGDTGGAVAHGFYDVKGVEVVILYPKGKVSEVQELQLTTLGKNITALQVEGNFDDCQQMVKKAFVDAELNAKKYLTSANSINVARWLPQQLYYFFAWKQWPHKNETPVISVPSGNFGNIASALLSYYSGLPVKHFIAACNANEVVPQFMEHGIYEPKNAVSTLSNAMDVGNPSNFIRIMQLFEQSLPRLKTIFSSISISDDQTQKTMQKVLETFGYLTDPHGAVAYSALEQYLQMHPSSRGYFVETAHPVKFLDVVKQATGIEPTLPTNIIGLMQKEKKYIQMENDYDAFKTFLMEN